MTEFKKWLDHNKLYLEAAYKVLDMEEYTLRAWELAQPQWQPIETAPEGGPFLVYGGLLGGDLFDDVENLEVVKVSGRDADDVNFKKSDAVFEVADADYYGVWVVNPTHWMPLPQPPTS